MKRMPVLLSVILMTAGASAQDRLVFKLVAGRPPLIGREITNSAPASRTISGAEFRAIQTDVEAAVRELGERPVWWDVGPDAGYDSIEIYLGARHYVINSWYPKFRANPKVAVSEKQGLTAVSGPEEKRRIEESNSAAYRRIVGLFEKVEAVLKKGAGERSQGAGSPTNSAASAHPPG